MALLSQPIRAVVTLSLYATFGLLHLLHLISHAIKLAVSVIRRVLDETNELLIGCGVRRRDVQQDLRSLKKRPAHLAVISIPINYQLHRLFSPHAFSLFPLDHFHRLRYQQLLELRAIFHNSSKIIRWSMQAGIKEITFYDERGLIKTHKIELIQHLANDPAFMRGNEKVSGIRIEPKLAEEVAMMAKFEISYQQQIGSATHTTQADTSAHQCITINLIDRQQGHPHLVKVTKALVEICSSNSKQPILNLEDLNVKTIGEKICSTSIGMPDLMMVLGGRSLRFRGFPPWQLTLTEIYHARSYAILPYRLRYPEYLAALNLFSNCQQRVGR